MYQLEYLNLRARGEPIRWILLVAGVSYTEKRIDFPAQWLANKQDYDWRRTPVLKVNGEQLHQTTVICRYLARENNLDVSDSWAAARVEEVAEAFHDVSNLVAQAFRASSINDMDQKKANMEKVKTRMQELVVILETCITPEGWIRSPKMTWVDVFVAAYLDLYEDLIPGLLKDCLKSKELLDKVKAIDCVKNWIEIRPPYHTFEDPSNFAVTKLSVDN